MICAKYPIQTQSLLGLILISSTASKSPILMPLQKFK
jgi:hypothetical protein